MQPASGSTAQTMERLQYRQGVACKPALEMGVPSKEPRRAVNWGVPVAVRFKAAHDEGRVRPRDDAMARLLPRAIAELETSAQENVPQRSDAGSVSFLSPSMRSVFGRRA